MEVVIMRRTINDPELSGYYNYYPFNGGRILNASYELVWTERFSSEGSFTLTSRDPQILQQLPIFTTITHTDTSEVMIVETHTIEEQEDGVSITITGTSLLGLLRYRRSWEYTENPDPINGLEYFVGDEDHLGNSQMLAIPAHPTKASNSQFGWGRSEQLRKHLWYCMSDMVYEFPDYPPTPKERSLFGFVFPTIADMEVGASAVPARSYDPTQTLYEQVVEFLNEFNMGVKSYYPPEMPDRAELVIHHGEDRTEDVVFSYFMGDIKSAFSAVSSKEFYTSARIIGRYWAGNYLYNSPVKFNGETIPVDSSMAEGASTRWKVESAPNMDVKTDGNLPTAAQYNSTYKNRYRNQARSLVRSTIPKTDIDVEISKNSRYVYNRDYGIGDLVTVDARFSDKQTMRVTEYTVIKDREGYYGQPTLSPI